MATLLYRTFSKGIASAFEAAKRQVKAQTEARLYCMGWNTGIVMYYNSND